MATIHPGCPEDDLTRLETMCLMANLGLAEIRMVIASAIQLITYQQHLPDDSRKVTHVVELCGLDNGRYVLRPLFRYIPETVASNLLVQRQVGNRNTVLEILGP